MKKCILLLVFNIVAISSWCQTPPLTSLSENFNADCVVNGPIPPASGWLVYNPVTTTIPWGQWNCTTTNGRPIPLGGTTPGMQCSDTFDNAYHLDTSYLITPLLYLASYDSVFLQFDTKTSKIHYGADFAVLITYNPGDPDSPGYVNITDTLLPLIGTDDSSNWVTHVANLTPFKVAPFYIAFRYTSTDTTGSIWFLDNVNTTALPVTLRTPLQNKYAAQLSVLGNSTANEINFSATSEPGDYQLALFDMVGREVYRESLNVHSNSANYSITGLDLPPGMYLLKMGNEHSFAVTKVMIR